MTIVKGRFKKNYKLDGWPIEDTTNQSVLNTDDLVVILNKQEKRIAELEIALALTFEQVYDNPAIDALVERALTTQYT